jgi:hypothetical protein
MAKRIAWDYIKDYGGPLQPKGAKPNESELRIDLLSTSGTAARIFLAGADNPDSLRGIYLDGAVIDESPLIPSYISTQILLPALSDRGGWLVHAGTPRGKNHFYDTYQNSRKDPAWYSLFLPASQSGIIPEEELTQLRQQMGDDEYMQEMECSFSALSKGQILFREITTARQEGRIGPHIEPASPRLSPVIATSDIGFRDTAAFWLWQIVPGGFRLISYISHTGLDAQDWIDLLSKLPLPPSTVYLPHDARARTFATKNSAQEQFITCKKFKVHIIPKTSILDRINAARTILPFCEFVEPATTPGISALEDWQYEYNPETELYSQNPDKTWGIHGSDSFSYGAQVLAYHIDEARSMRARKSRPPEVQGAHHIFTLDDLHKQEEPRRDYAF